MDRIKVVSDTPALIRGFLAAIEHFCDSSTTEVVEVAEDDRSLVLVSKDLDISIGTWELDYYGLNPLE